MCSNVRGGLQPCHEPGLIEPHLYGHKIGQPEPSFSHSFPSPQSNNNGDLSGWSFLQSLTNTSSNNLWKEVNDESNKVYVHPLVMRSSSALSTKSLEMCTESLGSETGSNISDNSCSSDEIQSLATVTRRSKSREWTRKLGRIHSFPPPLTFVGGSGGVQLRSQREGGRLVMEAVVVSSSKNFFRTERADGRLKLFLLVEDSSVNSDEHIVDNEMITENGEGEPIDDADGDGVSHDGYCHWCDEGMDVNGDRVACEIGIGELQRSGRCKFGGSDNKEMSTWGPFWMAIS